MVQQVLRVTNSGPGVYTLRIEGVWKGQCTHEKGHLVNFAQNLAILSYNTGYADGRAAALKDIRVQLGIVD